MKITKIILQGVVLMATATPAAFAQQAAPNYDQPTVNQRTENQQDRIANGVQSGQLTARETSKLESKESALNTEEHGMRAADNGHLTAGDRATLNRQQNRLSRQIYNKKHNGRVQ
jgi:phage-related tail fiber protein